MVRRRAFIAIALTLACAASAQAQELFRGKEITIFIGGGAGGGADIYGRLLSRHLGRHLPGSPAVIARNLPGAGGLRLANQLYNVSPKDGTELGMVMAGTLLEPLFGNKEAKFETTKFSYLGNMDSDATVCYAAKHTGIRTWADLKGRETTFGASGPASVASVQTKVMGELLRVRTRMIHGYQGVRTSVLAMQRGELDGTCGIYASTVRSQFAREVAAGEMTIWIAFDRERIKDFPQAPTIYELITNDDDRLLADLIYGQNAISRPVSAPPGLSAERTAALRNGMTATMADAAFLADANKLRLDITPMSGEDTQARFQAFYNLPAAVIARARSVIGGR